MIRVVYKNVFMWVVVYLTSKILDPSYGHSIREIKDFGTVNS